VPLKRLGVLFVPADLEFRELATESRSAPNHLRRMLLSNSPESVFISRSNEFR
jgi:hypothetical protein